MRRVLTLGLTLACATVAAAHHSASSWRTFHELRYLVCTDDPAERVHCVGPVRGKQRLLANLRDGDRDAKHAAAVDAVYFHVRDAVPRLRALLDDPDKGLRTEAAYALAHLGDAQSIDKIDALVRYLETDGYGTLWADALDALAVLDAQRASAYATDFMARASGFRTSMPGGSSKLLALDYIRSADALPVLERLAKIEETGYDHAHCRLMATRVRLDPALRAKVRTQLLGSYGGTWLAGCANDVIAQLGDPDDAAALVRHLGRDDRGMDFGVANIAYRRILEVLAANPPAAARAVLRKGLAERSAWPHVADPKHANYAPHFVAFHRAALAALGDPVARLYEIDGDAAWIAAYWALRLRLPDAAEHAARLIANSLRSSTSSRGDVYREIRARTVDAFADAHPKDARWAIAMLDPDRDANERALYRFSRNPSVKACEAVANAARDATQTGAENAFLGLTVLGAQCRPAIEKLFDDRAVDGEIRGAALEFLAVMESPKICEQLARAKAEGVWRPAIERAEQLIERSCKPVKVDQPVPPRVHKQGL